MANERSPKQYTGVRAINPPDLQLAKRAPTSNDNSFIRGQLWLNYIDHTAYMWDGAQWISMGSGATGGVVTITGDSGGAESPTAGNFNLKGTANQVTVTGSASQQTFSLPSNLIAPGNFQAVGDVRSDGDTVVGGNLVKLLSTTKDVFDDFATTTAAGDHANGIVTLVAGAATIATTSVTAASKIRLFRQDIGATGAAALGILTITALTGGVSFVINALSAANATTVVTTDVSNVWWEIVN